MCTSISTRDAGRIPSHPTASDYYYKYYESRITTRDFVVQYIIQSNFIKTIIICVKPTRFSSFIYIYIILQSIPIFPPPPRIPNVLRFIWPAKTQLSYAYNNVLNNVIIDVHAILI